MLTRFRTDERAQVAFLFTLMLVPLVGLTGVAIDLSHAYAVRDRLQSATDQASLAAVADGSPAVQAALKMRGDGEIPIGREEVLKFFAAQVGTANKYRIDSLEAKVVKKGNLVQAVVSYTAAVPTTLSRILAQEDIQIAGKATAEYQTRVYRDFYLLLDNSPSMGVGATPKDMSALIANTPDRCAFACHIAKDGVEDRNDYYNLAKRIGATTRINVVAKAAASLMDTAKSTRTSPNQFRIGVYSFGLRAEDLRTTEVIAPTSDLDRAKAAAATVDLMSIPFNGYDDDQQTSFDRNFTEVMSRMGTQGDGLSPSQPEKFLFFVSDGVGDSNKPGTCTKRVAGATRCLEPIDTRVCKALKDKGFKIAVLYTTYLPLPTNGFYMDWIDPFQKEIGPRMKECATPGLFFEVSPTEGIAEAMQALFKKIVFSPRISS